MSPRTSFDNFLSAAWMVYIFVLICAIIYSSISPATLLLIIIIPSFLLLNFRNLWRKTPVRLKEIIHKLEKPSYTILDIIYNIYKGALALTISIGGLIMLLGIPLAILKIAYDLVSLYPWILIFPALFACYLIGKKVCG